TRLHSGGSPGARVWRGRDGATGRAARGLRLPPRATGTSCAPSTDRSLHRAARRRPPSAPDRRSARSAGSPAPLVFPRRRARAGCCARPGPGRTRLASGFGAGTARPAPPPARRAPEGPGHRRLASGAPVVVWAPERDLQQPRSLVWISSSNSACSSRRSRRRLSRSSSATRFASGFTAFALRPRRCADSAANFAPLALAPPGDQMRGVQTLASQQRADLARGTRHSFPQDALLVFGRELSTLRFRRHLRIGRAAPLACAAARGRTFVVHVPKGQRQMVAALIRTVFAQESEAEARRQWRAVAD